MSIKLMTSNEKLTSMVEEDRRLRRDIRKQYVATKYHGRLITLLGMCRLGRYVDREMAEKVHSLLTLIEKEMEDVQRP